MPKNKNSELTEADRGKILGLRIGGSSLAKIAKTLNIPKTTVYNTMERIGEEIKKARKPSKKHNRVGSRIKRRVVSNPSQCVIQPYRKYAKKDRGMRF